MHEIRSTRNALVLAALIAFSACRSHSTAPTPNVVVRTAQTVYQVSPRSGHLTIAAIVTNAMNETLLLDGIGRDFVGLEKLVGDSWRWAYSPFYIMPAVAPIKVPSGGSRELSFGLFSGGEPNTHPTFGYEIPGTYRAVFGFRAERGAGFQVYSNEFELRTSQ